MISVHQAQSLLLENVPQAAGATIALGRAAGFVLAQDITADRDYPPFDRITHDGIAIDYASYASGRRSFPVSGYAAAGQARATLANAGACIEVATGAPLPIGCDTVVPYEAITLKNGEAMLSPEHSVNRFDCLHRQGSDLAAGRPLLTRGQRIGIQEMAMLAANGVARVPVFAKPAIGILSTGDELVPPEAPVLPHQIRRSNDLALKTALKVNGFMQVETAWAPDDKAAIARLLARWIEEGKWVFITGGVSRGKYDHVPEVLRGLGVRMLFHHVAQRPGKPLWLGLAEAGLPVFGLPGNPNSSLTCLVRYGLPALRRASGAAILPYWRRLAQPLKPHPALTLFVPVTLMEDLNAVAGVSTQGSGDFIALQGTAGFVELPPADNAYAQGEKVAFYPWKE